MSELHQFGERKDAGRQSEEGYVLLAVLFLVVLVLIGLAVAAPQMARSIQRDKEIELVHRGEEYKRAIKLYYRKFGAYPSSIDQLLNTNNIRFLRKRYTDPITGKDDWRLIYYGQAKVPPMGLFGQPLALVAGPTTGGPLGGPLGAPAGQSGQTGTVTVDQPQDQDNSNSNSDNAGDNNSNNANSGENAANNPSVTITGAAPTPSGTVTGTAAPGSGPGGANGAGGTNTGAFGSTLGGGPIVGVGIPSTKASLIEYKKQKQYNKWEFVYNPIEDTLAAGGMAGGNTTTVNGTNGTTPGTTTPGTTPGTATGPGVTPMNGPGVSSGTGGSSPDQQQ